MVKGNISAPILYLQHDTPNSKIFKIYHYRNIYSLVEEATMCLNFHKL